MRVVFCFLTYKNVYYCTCTVQKASDNSDVNKLFQNFESSVLNLLHVTLLAPWSWTQLLECLLICVWENINVMQLSWEWGGGGGVTWKGLK